MSCFPILFKENWVRRLKKQKEYSQKSINVIIIVNKYNCRLVSNTQKD